MPTSHKVVQVNPATLEILSTLDEDTFSKCIQTVCDLVDTHMFLFEELSIIDVARNRHLTLVLPEANDLH